MPPIEIGPRVCVYGPSGSGKTTVGRALAARLGVPFVELDAIYHARPDWDDLSRDEFREAVAGRLAELRGGWVIDGNYSAVRDLILPGANAVVWLRLPWLVVYPRLALRTISRGIRREPLWGTNYESLYKAFFTRDSMLLWGIQHWRPGNRKTAADLQSIPHAARVYVLRSPGQVRRFLKQVAPGADA